MLRFCNRSYSTSITRLKKALILGINTAEKSDKEDSSTPTAPPSGTQLFNSYDKKLEGRLCKLLGDAPRLKSGQARTFYGLDDEFSSVSIVGLGPESAKVNNLECLDEENENTRIAIAAGIKQLKDGGVENVIVDAAKQPQAAAEGAFLSSWSYKESERKKFPTNIEPSYFENPQNEEDWKRGKIYAECQNFARHLMECPSNIMTPTHFGECVTDAFNKSGTSGSVDINVYDRTWIEGQNMGAFLSVAQGSDEQPKFVEIIYESKGNDTGRPLVLVGKGVTFDTGGVSIKPSSGMDEMRGDMGGAATMSSALLAAARLNMPGKIIALIPLCENTINGKATKPGDVVTARNGTTIQVDNTDAEGRLLLADALSYAQELKPAALVNAATLTGAIFVALGAGASGVFTNDDQLWDQLYTAGVVTGDRLWRMPLFNFYTNQVKPAHLADLNNVGKGGRGGGSCTAAAFLRHFVEKETKWAHLDIAGVLSTNGTDVPYLCNGMAGRPTRTIAEFIRHFKSV